MRSTPACNSTFAIDEVSCSAGSFVVTESSVFRMNICAKKPPIANLQKMLCVILGGTATSN